SSTVSSTKVPRPSGTWATPRCTMSSVALPSIRSSPSRISPLVRTMPQIARNVVVLPAPLAPSNAVTPPCSTAKSIPCSTRVSPYPACSERASSNAGMQLLLRLAEIGADHLRFAADLVGRTVGDLQSKLQRHHLVGHAHHKVHVMLHQQDAEIEASADAHQQLREFI